MAHEVKLVKLDRTNNTILRTLLTEARTPLTSLSKKLDISIPSVSSRIEYLKKKGIIKGSIMQINPDKLGFSCCGVLQIFTSSENEKTIKQYLADKQLFFYDNEYFSKSSFGVFFAQRNVEELIKLINKIKLNSKILDVKPVIYNDLAKLDFPDNLVLPSLHPNKDRKNSLNERKNKSQNKKNNQEKTTYLDNKDIEIAKILTVNAQVPFSKIAKQIGISTNNVISRYKRLRNSGVITNSFITVDLTKLDYSAMIVIFIKASPPKSVQELYEQVVSVPNVILATKLLSPFDLLIIVPIINLKDVFELKKTIRNLRGIGKIEVELHSPFTCWPLNAFANTLEKIKI